MTPLIEITREQYDAARQLWELHQPVCASLSSEGTCLRVKERRVECRMGNCSWLGTKMARYAKEHGEG